MPEAETIELKEVNKEIGYILASGKGRWSGSCWGGVIFVVPKNVLGTRVLEGSRDP